MAASKFAQITAEEREKTFKIEYQQNIMPKKKRIVNSRQKREKDRERKRQKRQKPAAQDVLVHQFMTDSSVPCGAEEEAVSASPGNFPGLGFMGLPPKEEKPLARVQASPRVKMHSSALRLPSPRGSRLFVHEQDKAPSPDSLERVCAPPRAPGPDTVHVSGSAGQAQLETSMYGGTSRKTKDEGNLRVNKKETERKSNINQNENNEKQRNDNKKYRNKDEKNEKHSLSDKDIDGNTKKKNAHQCWGKPSKEGNNNIFYSVQGSFHQADPLFEDNAGTQCVANCLAGLAYHKLRNAMNWTSMDMDRILMTGDELYSFLQRSSSINDRYLLVEELPKLFECFNKSFKFHSNESIASVVRADDGLNYAEFNAFSLDDGLQIALADTDGCFICFGGNTFLIGKTENGFFAFDSHSRSSDGMLSISGKSTRVLLHNVSEVYSHIQSLALSMGYSNNIECNLTGVTCAMSSIENINYLDTEVQTDNEPFERSSVLENMNDGPHDHNDEVMFINQEQFQFSFVPLSSDLKQDLCQKLNVPYICIRNPTDMQCSRTNISTPSLEKEIVGDGNCFFRAISFCLSNSEDFHFVIRNTVCKHMIEKKELFQPFVIDDQNVESHILSTQMLQEGAWATELEIFATAHLLNTDIYTFSGGRWIKFSVNDVEPSVEIRTGSIYLNHQLQNHYNVVLSVNMEESILTQTANHKLPHEYEHRYRNRTRMQNIRQSSSKMQKKDSNAQKQKLSLRNKYKDDKTFREKKLKTAFLRYLDDEEFQANVRTLSRQRYCTDIEYNIKTKERSREKSKVKYATDPYHKQKVKRRIIRSYATDQKYKDALKRRSIEKYAKDDDHRENVKKRNIEKYATEKQHRDNMKLRSIQKYELNVEHREHVKAKSRLKYKIDEDHRMQVNAASTKKYKENDNYRKRKLDAGTTKYNTDDSYRSKKKASSKKNYDSSPTKKVRAKERIKNHRNTKRARLENQEDVVKLFKEKTMEGIDFSCCCCDRLFFQKQVKKCDRHTYAKNDLVENVAAMCIQEKYCHQCTETCAQDCIKSSLWICFTCHRKILSGKIPAEAAVNKMTLEDIPKELQELNSLEKHLIAIHIPFMKLMALPHGGQQNIHGPVVCVPSDLKKVTRLPSKPGEDLLLRVKLKRKLNYKGYIEYQFVNPKHIIEALQYLKGNNQWYENVAIDTNWKGAPEDCQTTSESDDESPNDNDQQQIATDTCLQPVDIAQEVLDHYFDDIYDIAPGEGNNPIKMLQEPGNEAKTFPYLFPSGKFSWNDNRENRITLSRYFNNRLMNTDDRFAKDSNYIFFSQFMSDLNQVIEKTQISVRKSVRKLDHGHNMNANMIQNPEILSNLMKKDEALRFMQPIRGTPAYWSAAQKDLFAMLRQLGIPTWFCSFSAAEHRWNDAIATILRQQNDSRDPTYLDWAEKNEVLRSNPVTVARMFEHRFHVFQTEVIFSPSQPIGKVTDYFQRVEFQQRGSPHMHCLFWVEDAPKLDEDGEEEVCNFIDKYVTCAIPSDNEDSELKDIVLSVQQHSKKHSKSCRKKGTECRFNFPRPPSASTFINTPYEEEIIEDDADHADHIKMDNSKAKEILLQVWNEVQDETNRLENTEQVFEKLGLTQSQYIDAHKRLTKKTSVVLKRNPSELWTNQYNPCLLKCWNANMDIQFVLDPFSCIVYIISYISKSEREMGMVLKQTKIEAEEGNESARTTLKKIGSAYLNHREVSAQEAVYRVCNLKMKECSRAVVFIPVGENPTRLTKPLSQIKRTRSKIDDGSDEEDDDEDIWMTNIVERYENRPNEPLFHNMCLAEFCSEFRVLAKSQVPKTKNENVFELQNSKGFIQKRTRTRPAIVRYPRFDAKKMSEKYYQSMLQLFLPYWGINQLKPPGFDQYETFYENGHVQISKKQKLQSVKSIVDTNKARYAQNEDIIAEAQENFENIGEPEDAWANLCPETELMRHEGSAERNVVLDLHTTEELPDMQPETNSDVLYRVQQNTQSREEIIHVFQNLNETQMKVFYLVREWCLKKSFGDKLDSLHIFITGGAGTGKSHLIKAIHYEASRLLGKQLATPDSVSVLLTAFTGTAAFNIGGNTIHHLFSLPKHMPLPYEPLREQRLSEIRVQLADLQILIIDEILMVYKRLLYYIHERLVQIKKCKEPFGGVSVIAVGDFYQLPPVKQRKDERLYKDNALYPFDYWVDLFKKVELTEIMRQREDIPFAEALNTLRTREMKQSLNEQTHSILKECIREGPDDVLHVYATNDEVNAYNITMLKKKCEDFVEIDAQDFTKDNTTGKLNMRSKPLTRSKTDNLPSTLLLGLGARVMLTRNCNVGDGLVNGVMGVVSKFVYSQRQAEKSVVAVGVLFDNVNVGKKTGKKSGNGNLVFIERVQEDIQDQKTKNVVRHQFPLRLSWACTAHKVQGLTVEKVVVNLDRTFSPGQGYVALSRVTTKQGLFIDSNKPELIQKKIYADPEVNTALQRMPKLKLQDLETSANGIKIYLHNIQSLGKHFNDLLKDFRCKNVDIICLTETWLRSGQNVNSFEMNGYKFYQSNREDSYDCTNAQVSQLRGSKGGGVAVYIKDTALNKIVSSLPIKNVEGISVKCLPQDIVVLTVYRPNSLDVTEFLTQLEKLITYYRSESKFIVCLGDFNEDARSGGPIQIFMTNQGLKQIVGFKTTEGATILDHVYLSKSLLGKVEKLSTYYSYHDALILTIIPST